MMKNAFLRSLGFYLRVQTVKLTIIRFSVPRRVVSAGGIFFLTIFIVSEIAFLT